MKTLMATLIFSAFAQNAFALQQILNCRSPFEGKSIVKKVEVDRKSNGEFIVRIEDAWSGSPVEKPILRKMDTGNEEYVKLVLSDDKGTTASLLMYTSGRVERAAIVYEGPKAPGPAGFGASVEFLDCN